VRVDGGTGRVTVAGRLARSTVPVLHEAVSTLLRVARTAWSIDVAGLVVSDDAGLRAIVGAYRRAVRHGRQLTLLGASPALHGALMRLRLARHLLPGDEPRPAAPALHGSPLPFPGRADAAVRDGAAGHVTGGRSR
jgi:anti-anti-sigma regulatory factor